MSEGGEKGTQKKVRNGGAEGEVARNVSRLRVGARKKGRKEERNWMG